MGISAFAAKIKKFFTERGGVDAELFEDLCDILVEGDFGAALAVKTVDALRVRCKKAGASSAEAVKETLAVLLTETLAQARAIPPERGAALFDGGADAAFAMALLLGVNGVGKTTTAAKLAFRAKAACERERTSGPILAAADTFRAAAIDQLKVHGERLGVRVVAHQSGGDSAAVVYDALNAAAASGSPLVIADTAGRMHTKSALVEELKKIDRVAERFQTAKGGESAPVLLSVKYLVLDATTGTNALSQAEVFNEAVKLDGVVLTKYDSSAKGGVAFSLAANLRLPVVFLCTGEKYEDIRPFVPETFVREFLGN